MQGDWHMDNDKNQVMKEKLLKLLSIINKTNVELSESRDCLTRYQQYVTQLIALVERKQLKKSNGSLLGLTRWLSDYEELEKNDELWNCAYGVDVYYKNAF